MSESWTEHRSAALHQAGHAVAAFKLGKPLEHLSTAPDKDQFGCVRFSYPDWFTPDREVTEPVWTLIEDHVMIWLAGIAAEDAWRQGVSDQTHDLNARLTVGAKSEAWHVTRHLHAALNTADVYPDTFEGYIERLHQRVLQWVGPRGAYSRLVYQLAVEVGRSQELSGLDAEIFLTEVEADIGDN